MFDFIIKRLHHSTFLRDKQKAFLEDLTAFILDGVSVNQAINTICEVSDGVTQRVAIHIAHCLVQGKKLADGMQGWFPRSLVELIRSGESSGSLLKSLYAAIHFLSEQIKTTRAVLSLMFYPLLILVATISMVVLVRHYVFDSYASIRPIVEWPSFGQGLYHFSFLVERWWWLVILVVIFIIFLVTRLLQQLTGEIRIRLDQLPFVSLYRDVIAARFMEILGLLISNGVALKSALSIMHRDACPYLSWHILKMEFKLNRSDAEVTNVIDTKLIHHRDIIRLRTIAKNKVFEEALIRVGQHTNQRAMQAILFVAKVSSSLILLFSVFMTVLLVLSIYSVGSVIVK